MCKNYNIKKILQSCTDPIVDNVVDAWRDELTAIASQLNISFEETEKQLRLHLPIHKKQDLESKICMPIYLKNIINSRLADYKHFHNEYIINCGAKELYKIDTCLLNAKELFISMSNSPPIPLTFKEVSKDIGRHIEKNLHYLKAYREDSVIRYGLFINDSKHPICYASFTPIDRPYITDGLASYMGTKHFSPSKGLHLARVYGFGRLPKNSISIMISIASKKLRSHNYEFITTAVNPLLGFNGKSIMASGFVPYALSPVAYSYNVNGEYRTRRQGETSINPQWEPPPNILFVRGLCTISRNRLSKSTKTIFIINKKLHNMNISTTNKIEGSLNTLRNHLESVWCNSTRYHLTKFTPNDPVSKGQCGVTSAYLARELEKQGHIVYFCEGGVKFSDNTPNIVDHCWLKLPEYKIGDKKINDLIIDLTADQSGFKKPVICDTLKNLEKIGIYYSQRQETLPNRINVNHLRRRLEYLQKMLKNINVSDDESQNTIKI